MQQLLGLLYKSRHFFLFLFLQAISFYLMSKNNVYWDVSFFNTTNTVVAKSLEVSQKTTEFISLGKINEQLAEENRILRKKLTDLTEQSNNPPGYVSDSLKSNRFNYITAKVIGSTHNLTNNFITIDKGTADGIKKGMGVISAQGVVGQVLYANEHYSRIYSLLHSKQMVSAEVLNQKLRETESNALGIAKWDGESPKYINLTNVDRFKPVNKGDSIVTSPHNPVFPPHIMIGRVVEVKDNSSEAFHKIKVRLSTDFSGLMYVNVVSNKLIESQIDAESKTESK